MRRLAVLFDERVIPNYRVSVFAKLAERYDLDLTVSYWRNRDEDEPPHIGSAPAFSAVPFAPCKFGRSNWFNFPLLKYVIARRPAVVLGRFGMFGVWTPVSWAVERLCTIFVGTKFVYRVSQPLPSGRGAGRMLRALWLRCFYKRAIVCSYGKRTATAIVNAGCPPRRMFVDLNAMDSETLFCIRRRLEDSLDTWLESFLRSHGIDRSGFVLFTGRLLRDKRVDVLIDAWTAISGEVPETQLVIVGSGPERPSLIAKARAAGSRVVFVDGMNDDWELSKFHLLSSMTVSPGYATLSTHFAMCFGKPLISSDLGNEAEYVEDGVNGTICPCGDVKAFSLAMLRLLRDPRARDAFGRRSERKVAETVNVEHMLRTFRAVIDFAVNES